MSPRMLDASVAGAGNGGGALGRACRHARRKGANGRAHARLHQRRLSEFRARRQGAEPVGIRGATGIRGAGDGAPGAVAAAGGAVRLAGAGAPSACRHRGQGCRRRSQRRRQRAARQRDPGLASGGGADAGARPAPRRPFVRCQLRRLPRRRRARRRSAGAQPDAAPERFPCRRAHEYAQHLRPLQHHYAGRRRHADAAVRRIERSRPLGAGIFRRRHPRRAARDSNRASSCGGKGRAKPSSAT